MAAGRAAPQRCDRCFVAHKRKLNCYLCCKIIWHVERSVLSTLCVLNTHGLPWKHMRTMRSTLRCHVNPVLSKHVQVSATQPHVRNAILSVSRLCLGNAEADINTMPDNWNPVGNDDVGVCFTTCFKNIRMLHNAQLATKDWVKCRRKQLNDNKTCCATTLSQMLRSVHATTAIGVAR